jgi:hypothetical protein
VGAGLAGYAQPAQPESERTFANFVAVPMICCRRLPSGRPDRAGYRLRRDRRNDVAKHANFEAALKLLDERLEIAVRAKPSRGRSSRPSIHAAAASTGLVVFAVLLLSLSISTRAISEKTAATNRSFDSKCR